MTKFQIIVARIQHEAALAYLMVRILVDPIVRPITEVYAWAHLSWLVSRK